MPTGETIIPDDEPEESEESEEKDTEVGESLASLEEKSNEFSTAPSEENTVVSMTDSDTEHIKVFVEDIFEVLNSLETALEELYNISENDPSLTTQLQAVRITRQHLNEAFPYETSESEPE